MANWFDDLEVGVLEFLGGSHVVMRRPSRERFRANDQDCTVQYLGYVNFDDEIS